MGADQNLDWAKAAHSALDWWREAGVDMLVDDAPRDWLAPPAPIARADVAAVQVAAPHVLPDTLDAFLAWRIGPDAPEAGWSGPTIPASGPTDARIMILVDAPERDDVETLMEGATGRLFDRMLAAIALSRDDVHLAGLCTRRPIAGRMPRDVEARLGEIALHHIALVAPKRLLLLGNAASRAILSTDVREAAGNLRTLNHKGGTVTEVIASYHPRFLLEKPACKAEAWRDLRMLTGGLS